MLRTKFPTLTPQDPKCQILSHIIYMFQCFATKNIWPGIFTFSLTLYQFVAKRFETFQSSDLVNFFNLFQLIYYIIYMFRFVSICFETFGSENLDFFFTDLLPYIFFMFQCFNETNACPGISAGVLCRL